MRLMVRPVLVVAIFGGSVFASFTHRSPQLFPGERFWIASPAWGNGSDASPAFTADGRTVYFTHATGENRTIVVSHYARGAWSQPVRAVFSGQWRNIEPAMSPDGSYLIFGSDRPTAQGGEAWMATTAPDCIKEAAAIYGVSIAWVRGGASQSTYPTLSTATLPLTKLWIGSGFRIDSRN